MTEELTLLAGPFSFYISFTRDTGVRLFDIRFGTSGDSDKKRIIYELGLDEAVAHCRISLRFARSHSHADSVYHHHCYLSFNAFKTPETIVSRSLLPLVLQADSRSSIAVQSSTAYLDSVYGFGGHTLGLLPGWDCPAYATYLDTVHHANEVTTTHVNARVRD